MAAFFQNNQFDFALMVTTVCFLDDVLTAFREAFRILKPRGSLLVGFVDKKSQLGKIYEAKKVNHPFYRFATFYSTEEIIQLLQSLMQEKHTNQKILSRKEIVGQISSKAFY